MERKFIAGRKVIEEHEVRIDQGSVNSYDYLPGKLVTIPARKGVKKAFKRKQFYLQGKALRSTDQLRDGDEVQVLEYTGAVTKKYALDLHVVFEDEFLAVVEKPAGIPTSGNQWKTLQNALSENLQTCTQKDALAHPLTVHRLDAKTHGLVLIAKTAKTRIQLGELFEKRKIEKYYTAIVQGKLEGQGVINHPIGGKEAITEYKVVDHFQTVKDSWNTIVQLRPRTGRKHQIRIHLSHLGHSIIGDVKYGEQGNTLKGKGMFLCAHMLKFVHPVTHEGVLFKIDVPNKFNRYIKRMKNWSDRIRKED